MGRIYTIPLVGVTTAAATDLFNIAATGNMAFVLHAFYLGQNGATAAESLDLSIRRMTATVTNGTGGSAVTPAKQNFGDTAATVTARANDKTTRATTNGSNTLVWASAWQLLGSFEYIPVPEDRLVFAPSQNCIIGLDRAPGETLNLSITAIIEELF